MDTFFDKISSYNIINYMLPGTIFAVISKNWLNYNFIINENILLVLIIIYFIGLAISRIGSIIIEPLLKKIKFIEFAQYEEFVKQDRKDHKISLLNETNNTFRTLIATIILLLFLKLYQYLSIIFCFSQYNCIILIICLLILFLFSYRKQSLYIKRRVSIVDEEKCDKI